MVPWIFLGVGVLFLLLTVNSFHPIKNNLVLFVPSFFASWLTNELAWLYAFVTVGIAALFFGPLGANDGVGIGGLIFMAITVTLLVVVLVKGWRTKGEITNALGDYGLDQSIERASRRKITRKTNVAFGTAAGKKQRLDVTMPAGPVAPGERRPALLQIHGGAWIIGDKREQGRPLVRRLASNGWVCFNANYRLSPGATWPDHLVDCKKALAWIRDHAEEYGVDPDFIAVSGGSAGGHLSAMMALTADDKSYQPGFEDADCSIQAAVPLYGVYDFTNRLDTQSDEMTSMVLGPLVMKAFIDEEPEKFSAASPMDRVRPDAPPFFVLHGDKDTLAPVEDARHFVELLRATSDSEVFYAELKGAQHAFDIFSSPRTRRALVGVQRFLFEAYERSGSAPSVDEDAPGQARMETQSSAASAAAPG